MVEYKIFFSKKANKHKKLLSNAGLQNKVKTLINILKQDPYEQSYHYEQLKYGLSGLYSRRINYQHRLVYEVDEKNKEITIYSMWSHYEKLWFHMKEGYF